LGLCGAYNYLDAAASNRLNPAGPNQPVEKGRVIDLAKGQWEGVNAFVYETSHKHIERFNAYSMMEDPMTSCLVGDTAVIIDNQVVRIGDFVDVHRGGDEYAKSQVLTLNGGQATFEPIVAMQRFPAPDSLIRVQTKSGVELTLTANHRIAIDRPEGLHWVRADEVRTGDRVISLRKLELETQVPQVIDLLPEDFRVADATLVLEFRGKLQSQYGSLQAAYRDLGIPPIYAGAKSIPIGRLKQVAEALGEDWQQVKGRITTVSLTGDGSEVNLPELDDHLFYLLGLIASDGSVARPGGQACAITFGNSNPDLLEAFEEAYHKVFPYRHLGLYQTLEKGEVTSVVNGREARATQDHFVCHAANPLLGILCDHFGVKMEGEEKWNLGRMISLPQECIAAFLAGCFDGDGSVRLRKYDGRWEMGEAYLCIADEGAARHLQILLKRLGIVGNVRPDRPVWKVELHGSNVRRFAERIESRHSEKKQVLEQIRSLPTDDRLDKTQTEVLPLAVGKALAAHATNLSPSTRYYYETGRSRPVKDNVRKVLEAHPETANLLQPWLDHDYFLDLVTGVEEVENRGQYRYVYNLTLKDTHAYFAPSVWAENCGCFECIVAIVPEANGVAVVNREYPGDTPMGMRFTTLAGSVGGGLQTPGFIGVGRLYLTSKKFISADGGLPRIVWMPRELKEAIRDRLQARAEELGLPDFPDKIADETIATTPEELLVYLEQVEHPALMMEMMF
jgi:intein/homing endonuclease